MDSVILKKTNKKKNLADAICLEPWYHLVIKVDGETGPCCIFSEKKMNVKDKSLKEIWYSNYFNNLRKSILSGKLPKYCKICNAGQVIQNNAIRKQIRKCMNE